VKEVPYGRELRQAFRFFDGLRERPKVTVFGSARLPPDSPAFRQAVEFGREMALLGWFVVTGAGEGVMEAAHLGAGREHSIGVNILLPFEQPDNTVMAGSPRLIHTKYFFTRKLLLLKESSGIALFRRGMISPEDLSLFRITTGAGEAVQEIRRYYRVFHRARYVGKDLVIRVRRPLDRGEIGSLNDSFRDLLEGGTFRQTRALPEEADDLDAADLSRIVFHFNCRSFGRVRQLIDFLNGV